LGFLTSERLTDLYDLLQRQTDADQPNRPAPRLADLSTLGDYWLTSAIQQNLIHPLNLEDVQDWKALSNQDIWTTLVRRDAQGQPNRDGEIWAAPYRWGTLMIAYHAEQFQSRGWTPPTDWSDLWRSELQRFLSLPESPRLVIGLVLKKLGRSVNPENLDAMPDLKSELSALHQQTKFYSSETYLQPLVLEDTLLAVGWSNEILPLVDRNPRLAAVVPQSGTILTADLWVRPATAPPLDAERSTLLNQWIEFCWEQPIAAQLSSLTAVASPVFFGVAPNQLPPSLQSNNLLLPSPELLEKSEFLLPLTDETINQFRRLWIEVRQTETPR
jgi:putative spermidine/putrescine transport system substrate-binding protein